MSDDHKRHAPATLRNREAILDVLQDHAPTSGLVLEIASGSGEHAAYFTPRLPQGIIWQPSDLAADALAGINAHATDTQCDRILPAIQIDVLQEGWADHLSFSSASHPSSTRPSAIFCANMIHIAPWEATCGLFKGAAHLLSDGGVLLLYGPFKRRGAHTAESNQAFDETLKARDPGWGIRDLDLQVEPEARKFGFEIRQKIEMPANNMTIIFEYKV